MSRASNRKQEMVAIVLGLVTVAALIGNFLILPLRASLKDANAQVEELELKQKLAKTTISKGQNFRISGEEEIFGKLRPLEAQMPSGDVYFWMLKAVRKFEESHGIIFDQIEPPSIVESDTIPKVPYPMANFILTGKATYRKFGEFLADLENTYPFMRFKSIDLEQASIDRSNRDEFGKVKFRIELSAFIKAQTAATALK